MRVLGFILRAFSILFHLLIALFLLILGGLAWGTGEHSLQIGLLPWSGVKLTYVAFFAGLGGVLITLLAWKRIVSILFLLWSLTVLVMLVRGFFFGAYHFGSGSFDLTEALIFIGAALIAVIGAYLQFRPRSRVRGRKAVYA